MGMFDYVEYLAPCLFCGHPVTGWQSKSGDCGLDRLLPSQVTNFYSTCSHCGGWNEYKVVPTKYSLVPDLAKMKLIDPDKEVKFLPKDPNEETKSKEEEESCERQIRFEGKKGRKGRKK